MTEIDIPQSGEGRMLLLMQKIIGVIQNALLPQQY